MIIDSMEKKFYHEKLRRPPDDHWRMVRALTQLLADHHEKFPGKQIKGWPIEDVAYYLAKFYVPAEIGTAIIQQGALGDPSLGTLMKIGSWMLKEPVQSFVFTKEFFKILLKTQAIDLPWSALPEEFLGVLRFPEPILDNDGDKITDVAVAIRRKDQNIKFGNDHYMLPSVDNRPGSRVLYAWYECNNGRGGNAYFNQVIPDDDEALIVDSWDRSYSDYAGMLSTQPVNVGVMDREQLVKNHRYIFDIMKCLVYVNSGNPDLRAFRNKIRYQSAESKTPVRDHKPYSELEYNLVGWNWKKEREQHTDSWGVEPFLRRQRVGPGRMGWKYVMVKEHTRSWKSKEGEQHAGQ